MWMNIFMNFVNSVFLHICTKLCFNFMKFTWVKYIHIQVLKYSYQIMSTSSLKYGFCNKSFRKEEPLTSWTLLQHICPPFWAWLLLHSAITPKSENKYVQSVQLVRGSSFRYPYFSDVLKIILLQTARLGLIIKTITCFWANSLFHL